MRGVPTRRGSVAVMPAALGSRPRDFLCWLLGSANFVAVRRIPGIGAATSRRADRTHYARRVGRRLGSLIIITV